MPILSQELLREIDQTSGLVLITGPRRCGKSTALREIEAAWRASRVTYRSFGPNSLCGNEVTLDRASRGYTHLLLDEPYVLPKNFIETRDAPHRCLVIATSARTPDMDRYVRLHVGIDSERNVSVTKFPPGYLPRHLSPTIWERLLA